MVVIHAASIDQSAHLQGRIPLPLGYGQGYIKGLLRAVGVPFLNTQELAMATHQAPGRM